MKICFCVLIIQVVYTYCLFPDHIDLQKLAEIKHNGEKYKLLKPTVHKMEDYFEAFIQKRSNNKFPTKRIFLDRNGFRHFWEGMLEMPKTSRKSDVSKDNNLKNETIEIKDSKRPDKTNLSKEKPKRKKPIQKDVPVPVNPGLRQEPAQIITTFFCPHFGVLKMISKFDNFDAP